MSSLSSTHGPNNTERYNVHDIQINAKDFYEGLINADKQIRWWMDTDDCQREANEIDKVLDWSGRNTRWSDIVDPNDDMSAGDAVPGEHDGDTAQHASSEDQNVDMTQQTSHGDPSGVIAGDIPENEVDYSHDPLIASGDKYLNMDAPPDKNNRNLVLPQGKIPNNTEVDEIIKCLEEAKLRITTDVDIVKMACNKCGIACYMNWEAGEIVNCPVCLKFHGLADQARGGAIFIPYTGEMLEHDATLLESSLASTESPDVAGQPSGVIAWVGFTTEGDKDRPVVKPSPSQFLLRAGSNLRNIPIDTKAERNNARRCGRYDKKTSC